MIDTSNSLNNQDFQPIPQIIISEAVLGTVQEVIKVGGSAATGGLLLGLHLQAKNQLIIIQAIPDGQISSLASIKKRFGLGSYIGQWRIRENKEAAYPKLQPTAVDERLAQRFVEGISSQNQETVTLLFDKNSANLSVYYLNANLLIQGQNLQIVSDYQFKSAAALATLLSPPSWHSSPDGQARLNKEIERISQHYKIEKVQRIKDARKEGLSNIELGVLISRAGRLAPIHLKLQCPPNYPHTAPAYVTISDGKLLNIKSQTAINWKPENNLSQICDDIARVTKKRFVINFGSLFAVGSLSLVLFLILVLAAFMTSGPNHLSVAADSEAEAQTLLEQQIQNQYLTVAANPQNYEEVLKLNSLRVQATQIAGQTAAANVKATSTAQVSKLNQELTQAVRITDPGQKAIINATITAGIQQVQATAAVQLATIAVEPTQNLLATPVLAGNNINPTISNPPTQANVNINGGNPTPTSILGNLGGLPVTALVKPTPTPLPVATVNVQLPTIVGTTPAPIIIFATPTDTFATPTPYPTPTPTFQVYPTSTPTYQVYSTPLPTFTAAPPLPAATPTIPVIAPTHPIAPTLIPTPTPFPTPTLEQTVATPTIPTIIGFTPVTQPATFTPSPTAIPTTLNTPTTLPIIAATSTPSPTPTSPPTPTPTLPEATNTPKPTRTHPTDTPTPTTVAPTATTVAPTATPTPTDTPTTVAPTPTTIPPTATATDTPTATPTTVAPTATTTPTTVPPTATATPTTVAPTDTPTPTVITTTVAPTATPTPTLTNTVTVTDTPTPTVITITVAPTATPTPTVITTTATTIANTPTPTLTNTITIANTPTPTLTNTVTATNTPTPTTTTASPTVTTTLAASSSPPATLPTTASQVLATTPANKVQGFSISAEQLSGNSSSRDVFILIALIILNIVGFYKLMSKARNFNQSRPIR